MDATKSFQAIPPMAAVFMSGMYFGSSQFTLPLLYKLPNAQSTRLFDGVYHRGKPSAISLAVISTAGYAGLAYWMPNHRTTYVVAAASCISTMLWTGAAMMGTIQELLAVSRNPVEQERVGKGVVEGWLRKWAWMNFVRSGLAFVGGAAGVSALLG